MSVESGVIKRISWRDLMPWLLLMRVFRVAIKPSILFLALVALTLSTIGWRTSYWAWVDSFEGQNGQSRRVDEMYEFKKSDSPARQWPGAAGPNSRISLPVSGSSTQISAMTQSNSLRFVHGTYVTPVTEMVRADLEFRYRLYYATGLVWMLIVWGIAGGAIARIAVVELGAERRIGIRSALAYSSRKLVSYSLAPLFPLLGAALVAIPCLLIALLMNFDVGVLLAGLLWPIALLCGLLMTILIVGTYVGWPLMWASIGSEQQGDVFDAFSRTFSYVYQRPLHYLFYVIVGGMVGALGWYVVELFCGLTMGSVIHVSEGLVEDANVKFQRGWLVVNPENATAVAGWGAAVVNFCSGVVYAVPRAFLHSFYWCAAAGIYLLLRRDVDHTELDDVYLEDEETPYSLPDLNRAQEESEGDDQQRNTDDADQPTDSDGSN